MTSAVAELTAESAGGKSPRAFRTISEVADELDVPQHVLRFWESRFPQIKPLKRGGGRRYYRPSDVELLARIRDLLYHEGYTIKGAQKLLRDSAGRDRAAAAAATEEPAALRLEDADPGVTSTQGDRLEDILSELMELSDILRRSTR